MIDVIDRNGVSRKRREGALEDGDRVRVPALLMDSAAKAIADHIQSATGLHDGTGGPAGYRPGFIYSNRNMDDRAQGARDAMIAVVGDAWRGDNAPAPIADAQAAHDGYLDHLQNAWRA
jgi:hypothetical protein